jgi:hypothetical protein
VAYTSNESGLSEIYVIPFPPTPTGGRWMVSRGGGVQPRWRRDGRELFYISPDGTMMAVPVSAGPVFQAGIPQALFNTDMVDTGIRTGPMSWDIAPDGKRFLIISDKSQETSSLNVILNWAPGRAEVSPASAGDQRLLARYRRPQFGGICCGDSLRTCSLIVRSSRLDLASPPQGWSKDGVQEKSKVFLLPSTWTTSNHPFLRVRSGSSCYLDT